MRRLRAQIITLLILHLFVGLASPSYAAKKSSALQSAGTGSVISLSDIHFNPFYDAKLLNSLIQSDYRKWKSIFSGSSVKGYGDHSADTNFNLLISTLNHARKIMAHPDFIIISGDFLAHDFQQTYASMSGSNAAAAVDSFIDKTIAFVALMIDEHFPNTPVYSALGNNDSYCGDYKLQPGGEFLNHTAQAWKGLFRSRFNTASFLETFPASGAYTVIAPKNKRHRIIVANTVFFSNKYVNACGNSQANPAQDEVKWLKAQLQKAAASNEKVWLLYHIPPGIDVYSSIHSKSGSGAQQPVSYFTTSYNQQFLDLVSQYSSIIAGSFAGHTHMDSFELVCQGIDKKAASFVDITPAISPLFGNNPGFKIFKYNRESADLIDYETYYLNLGAATGGVIAKEKWAKEYSFSKAYGQRVVNALSLQAVYQLMLINYEDYMTNYTTYYNVSNAASPPFDESSWPAYWCGIGYLTGAQFTKWNQILIDESNQTCKKNP